MTFRFPSPLYAIADPCGRDDLDPVKIALAMLDGGARVLQLRWKTAPTDVLLEAAKNLVRAARERGALLVVNDRLDVALAAEADAVHLGQEDLPLAAARRAAGGRLAIGISTHDLDQARAAESGGADYIGFGPLFDTATKATGHAPRGVDRLREVRAAVRVPIVAIGGIRQENAAEVLAAGADAVAMISDLCLAADVSAKVRRLLALLRR